MTRRCSTTASPHSSPPAPSSPPSRTGSPRWTPRRSNVSTRSCAARPLYSYVAPMSWLVRNDVERARDEFNLSDWGEDGDDADDAIEMIQDGAMPPGRYTLIHRGAALTAAERDTRVQALMTMSDDDDDHHDDDDD
ncbi:MAG: heme-binding domain-containing protein [Ilumatobacteraceae bacterium]